MNKEHIAKELKNLKKELFEKALGKIAEIEKISTNFESTNLKLYNVSSYLKQAVGKGVITEKQAQQAFETICEFEYEYIVNKWEGENFNYVNRSYIERTSSFYYSSNWYGDIIDNEIIVELLEGKSVLKEIFGDLDSGLYDYLFTDDNIISNFDDFNKNDFEQWIYDETKILENVLNDLKTVEKIVLEAKRAYDYLAAFKTKENEIAKEYLHDEIEETYAAEAADKIFDKILDSIENLYMVKHVEVSHSLVNGYYCIAANVDETVFNIETEINEEHELSEHAIDCLMDYLNGMINSSFSLSLDA